MRIARRYAGPLLLVAVAALVVPAAIAQRSASQSPDPAVAVAALPLRAAQRVTREQLENVEARISMAVSIVNRLEPEAKARGLSDGWRQSTLETMLPLSENALRQVESQAFSLDALPAAVTDAADDPNLIGDPNRDLTYTPIVPCRFIDTRNVAGRINGTRPYDLSVTGATYGGSAGCNPIGVFGVTDDEQIGAIAMNVTIVDPLAAPGFAAVKPTAAAPVTSLVNWYQVGPSVQAANQGIASISQTPVGTTTNFVIQTSAAVHVIVDFFGAFIEPQATALQRTVVASADTPVANGANGTITSPSCPATYTATGGTCVGGHFGMELVSSSISGNAWFCAYRNTSGVASYMRAEAVCARIPGR